MAEQAPIFERGQVVYVKESAALGFLEPFKIQSISYPPCGGIKYTICTGQSGPTASTTMGDRITKHGVKAYSMNEEDLMLYSEAICLVEQSLARQLTAIQQLNPNPTDCDV